MPADERILIEILTAANLSGLEKASSGLMSLGSASMGAAAVLIPLVEAGKSLVEISRAQSAAEANLTNAVDNRNAALNRAPVPDPKAQAELAKATKDVATATKAHAHEVRQLAELQVSVRSDHKITRLELMHLQDQQAKVAESTATLTEAQQALSKAQAATNQTQRAAPIAVADLRREIGNFMQTNRDYISNQADVVQGFAAFVREGVPVKDLTNDMNTALNISVGEGIDLTEAVNLLQAAEAGRNKGLSKMVGLTLEAIPATATMAEKEAIVRHNIDLVSKAYDDNKKALDPLQIATNDLSNDWQDLARTHGPALVDELAVIVKAIDTQFVPGLERATKGMQGTGTELDTLIAKPSWDKLWHLLFGDAASVITAPFTAVPGSAGSQQYPHGVGTYTGPRGSMVGTAGQNDPLGTGNNRGQADDMHFQNEQLAGIKTADQEALTNLKIIANNTKAQPRPNVNNITVNSTNQTDAQLAAMIARNLRKIGQV